MADRPRFSVHFDEEAFTEDLEHATPAGARCRPTRVHLTPTDRRRTRGDQAHIQSGVTEGAQGAASNHALKGGPSQARMSR